MAKAKQDFEKILGFLIENDEPIRFRDIIKQLFGKKKEFYVYFCKKCNSKMYLPYQINIKKRKSHKNSDGISCRSILKPVKVKKTHIIEQRLDISDKKELKRIENRVRKNLEKYQDLFPIILCESKKYTVNYNLIIDKILNELNEQNKVSWKLSLNKEERNNLTHFLKRAILIAILSSNNSDKKYKFDLEKFPVDVIKAIARKEEHGLPKEVPHQLYRPCIRYDRTIYRRIYELNI